MKASEAPEKIILSADRDTQIINDYWVVKDYTDNIKIEYTRTDAFIEAVADWIADNLQTVSEVETPSAHHVESIPELGIITQTEFIEKFKKEIMFLLD